MRCLQHFTDPTEPPVGLWWVDGDGSLQSTYADDHGAEFSYAFQVMTQKLRAATWDQHFDALENVYPYISGWESVDVSTAPEFFLKTTRRITKLAS